MYVCLNDYCFSHSHRNIVLLRVLVDVAAAAVRGLGGAAAFVSALAEQTACWFEAFSIEIEKGQINPPACT